MYSQWRAINSQIWEEMEWLTEDSSLVKANPLAHWRDNRLIFNAEIVGYLLFVSQEARND